LPYLLTLVPLPALQQVLPQSSQQPPSSPTPPPSLPVEEKKSEFEEYVAEQIITILEDKFEILKKFEGVRFSHISRVFSSGEVSIPIRVVKKEGGDMRVHYDNEVDAVYIKLGSQKPDGVVEISEGVNLDTTSENRIVGIEILNASQKMNINTILSYELELDKKLIKKSA